MKIKNVAIAFEKEMNTLVQFLEPKQIVSPQIKPDFIHSARDREYLPTPQNGIWQDLKEWAYLPIDFQLGVREVHIERFNFCLLGLAVLGYIGLAVYLKRKF